MDWTFVREAESGIIYPFDLDDLQAEGVSASQRTDPRSLAKHGVYHVHIRGNATPPVGYRAVLPDQPEKRGLFWVREYVYEALPEDEVRAALKTTRARFALAACSAGVVTDVEAEAWAGGTALPQIVTDAFAENIADPTERLAARIEALTTANIHRTNPLILMLQANPRIDLTDEQADALFG